MKKEQKSNYANKFYAIGFNNQIYEFELGEDNLLYCDIVKNKAIRKLYIKPNFEIFFKDGGYLTCEGLARTRNQKDTSYLIGHFHIKDELLEYLVGENLISYSTEMAYLYGLTPLFARDAKEKTRAFKRVKRKSDKILTKQKQGIFN